jgi:hypothetical protein
MCPQGKDGARERMWSGGWVSKGGGSNWVMLTKVSLINNEIQVIELYIIQVCNLDC